jgi:YqaJ-like viral recombinase domain
MMAIINVTMIKDDAQWHELRSHNIGASEVGALFGVHDYVTGYGLAARKLGLMPGASDTSAMQRGRLLEPVAKNLLAEEKPEWEPVEAGRYYCDESIHFGCTPDHFVRDPERGLGVVQIKSVAPAVFARSWHNEDGEIQPPTWIALQAMAEQHLTSANFAYIAALIVDRGITLELIEVPYLPGVVDNMRDKVKAFWDMVETGELPPPDYGRDLENLNAVLRLDDGNELDLTFDNELPMIAERLKAARESKRMAEEAAERAQAELLHRIGTAQRVRFSGGIINAKTQHRNAYEVKATDFRPVRLKFNSGGDDAR